MIWNRLDGPTSQYHNKVIVRDVANHASTYGVDATWNYWKAGHGKETCDGLGGTVSAWPMMQLKREKLPFKIHPIFTSGHSRYTAQ